MGDHGCSSLRPISDQTTFGFPQVDSEAMERLDTFFRELGLSVKKFDDWLDGKVSLDFVHWPTRWTPSLSRHEWFFGNNF